MDYVTNIALSGYTENPDYALTSVVTIYARLLQSTNRFISSQKIKIPIKRIQKRTFSFLLNFHEWLSLKFQILLESKSYS